MEKRKKKELQIGDILKEWQFSKDREKSKKYVRFEFQDYGIRLAYRLNDIYHKSLYIRLAKTVKREYLDEAYRFAIDYPNMGNKNKGRIFMWALSKIRKGESLYTKK